MKTTIVYPNIVAALGGAERVDYSPRFAWIHLPGQPAPVRLPRASLPPFDEWSAFNLADAAGQPKPKPRKTRPEKFRIAESFRPLLTSLLTSTTCGEACWHAREPICRCECGGKNHGCLRTGDGSRPTRAAKIAGASYELAAVGTYANLAPLACNMNESRGWSMIDARAPEYRYHYTHKDTDPGAPARLRPASADQCARWEELAAWKGTRERPYLLWKRRDEPPGLFTYCPDDCARCAQHRATWAEEIAADKQPEPAPPAPTPAPTPPAPPAPPAAGALTQLAFLL